MSIMKKMVPESREVTIFHIHKMSKQNKQVQIKVNISPIPNDRHLRLDAGKTSQD
jgi:hypothetical protein